MGLQIRRCRLVCVTRCADWIIVLGPDLGDKGGEIVVVGTPETVPEHPTSHTGRYLTEVLKQLRQ